MNTEAQWAIVAGLAVLGSSWDLATRRIPNWLTFGGAVVAVGTWTLDAGFRGMGISAAGWAVGLLLFIPMFAVRGMGAGDVKFLAAFGACLGPRGALWSALWAALFGGVLAVGVSLARGYLGTAFANVGGILGVWRTVGPGPIGGLTLADARGPRVAYALPIAAGAMAALWLRQV